MNLNDCVIPRRTMFTLDGQCLQYAAKDIVYRSEEIRGGSYFTGANLLEYIRNHLSEFKLCEQSAMYGIFKIPMYNVVEPAELQAENAELKRQIVELRGRVREYATDIYKKNDLVEQVEWENERQKKQMHKLNQEIGRLQETLFKLTHK